MFALFFRVFFLFFCVILWLIKERRGGCEGHGAMHDQLKCNECVFLGFFSITTIFAALHVMRKYERRGCG